jgi:hypothetical protein
MIPTNALVAILERAPRRAKSKVFSTLERIKSLKARRFG